PLVICFSPRSASPGPSIPSPTRRSSDLAAWFGQAALEATALDHDRLTTAHLLLAACAERGTVGADALAAHGVDPQRVRDALRRRSEEHTSELQSRENLVCRLLLAKKTEH